MDEFKLLKYEYVFFGFKNASVAVETYINKTLKIYASDIKRVEINYEDEEFSEKHHISGYIDVTFDLFYNEINGYPIYTKDSESVEDGWVQQEFALKFVVDTMDNISTIFNTLHEMKKNKSEIDLLDLFRHNNYFNFCEKSDYYNLYLTSEHWNDVRRRALERAGNKCSACADSDSTLNVHHNDYSRIGRELDTDVLVLCEECHAWHHKKKKNNKNN